MKRLRKERGLSQERLAYAMWQLDDTAPTPGAIGHIERGETRPKSQTMILIARALEVPPETFAEYRLEMARRQLDERHVGFERAVANLEKVAHAGLA